MKVPPVVPGTCTCTEDLLPCSSTGSRLHPRSVFSGRAAAVRIWLRGPDPYRLEEGSADASKGDQAARWGSDGVVPWITAVRWTPAIEQIWSYPLAESQRPAVVPCFFSFEAHLCFNRPGSLLRRRETLSLPLPRSRWLCLCVYTSVLLLLLLFLLPCFCFFCVAASAADHFDISHQRPSPAQPKGGTARPGDILTRSDSTGALSIAGSSIARSLALHRSVWLRLLVGWPLRPTSSVNINININRHQLPVQRPKGDRQRLEPATKRKPSHIACPPPRDGGEIDSALDETKIYTNIQPPQEEATRAKKKKKQARKEDEKKKRRRRKRNIVL
ncbi:hypothetical protein TRV_02937 [Trichophyton verrucosum HKI 0517]|uniref:Uncharacterized protein n=1 Tax=Trichophyton verrucosum (strain HKI 0517) TaxID=663202 RepID=D4D758_TRIVH|nr:uncharacterized protein TRV_02937 [Trichophyton verrucosum HKI 0517]EFE42332.1 hypothetical protein TRV_02937 [Trichophyton verrucosum HKI 0517]